MGARMELKSAEKSTGRPSPRLTIPRRPGIVVSYSDDSAAQKPSAGRRGRRLHTNISHSLRLVKVEKAWSTGLPAV